MRLTSVKTLKVGEKIAVSIFSSNGGRILTEGAVASELYAQRLQQMGIGLIWVEDERFTDVIFSEPVNIKTRLEAVQAYKAAVDAVSKGKEPNEYSLKDVTKAIVDDVKASTLPVGVLNDVYAVDDPLAFHAVNTAILAVAIGSLLGYNFGQLCDLSLAGFIHDFGRDENTNDAGVDHAQKGFDALRKSRALSLNATIVAHDHHENFDGTGFPRGLKGQNISEFSRIVSIADYFDSLISGQNDNSITYEKAFEEILNNSDKKFDPDLVQIFKNTVQVYITGTVVVLNDGRQGILVGQNPGAPLRPIVRLFSESLPEFSETINLMENLNINIQKIIL